MCQGESVRESRVGDTHIKLPSLDVLARLFARDYHDQFADFAADHPFVEL